MNIFKEKERLNETLLNQNNSENNEYNIRDVDKDVDYYYNRDKEELCHEEGGLVLNANKMMNVYIVVLTAYSVLKCPKDRPLMDRYLACWSCDEPTPIDMSFNQEKFLGASYN